MRLAFLTASFLLTLIPVLANAESSDLSGETCRERVRGAGVELGDKAQIRDWPHGCLITNGSIEFGPYQNWAFKRAEIKSDDVASLKRDMAMIPNWGRVAVEGLTLRFPVTSAVTRYITALQQWPMDFSGSYHWYPAEGRLEVDNVELSSLRGGLVAASGDFVTNSNATPQSLAAMSTLGISRLRLRLDNQGLFESVAGPSLVAALSAGAGWDADIDIDERVEASKTQAAAVLTAIPDAQIDKESRQALIRFVRDLPHPGGFFSLEIEFPKPFMVGELDPGTDPVAALKLLSGAKITAQYTAR